MPHATGHVDAARSAVFAPLDGTGRAELVEQRLTDAIVSGMLRDGERLPSESDLSRSLGVAVVTAREALEAMREKGLVRTRRGRDGGSFVTYDRDTASRLVRSKLRGHSRIELRDLALLTAAITGSAAELAADRASDDDLETLAAIQAGADSTTAGGARRALARFQLEIAAVSQSPRLVREVVRLQAEAGPLLWLCLQEQEYRDRSTAMRDAVVAAIRTVDPGAAREAVRSHIAEALEWLVDEKVRIERVHIPEATHPPAQRKEAG